LGHGLVHAKPHLSCCEFESEWRSHTRHPELTPRTTRHVVASSTAANAVVQSAVGNTGST